MNSIHRTPEKSQVELKNKCNTIELLSSRKANDHICLTDTKRVDQANTFINQNNQFITR